MHQIVQFATRLAWAVTKITIAQQGIARNGQGRLFQAMSLVFATRAPQTIKLAAQQISHVIQVAVPVWELVRVTAQAAQPQVPQ